MQQRTLSEDEFSKEQYAFYSDVAAKIDGYCIYRINGIERRVTEVCDTSTPDGQFADLKFVGRVGDNDFVQTRHTSYKSYPYKETIDFRDYSNN